MNPRVLALLMRPTPGQNDVLVLPLIAFATVSALVLTVIGGAQSFWGWDDPEAPIYHALAAIALVLLVVPLLTLGGAAARLSARRRDERLSTLRLLGVTPAGVVLATVVESALLAAVGALAGLVLHILLVPLVGLIPFRGAALGAGAVFVPVPTTLAILVGIVLLAAGSAAIGLRKVVISPLGVRTRTVVTKPHWMRAVITVAALVAAFVLISLVPSAASMLPTIIVLTAVFAIAFAVLNVIGPWVLGIQARRRLRRADRPDQLLSARTVLESPKAAWRQVSGIAMASFIAVFAGSAVAALEIMGSGSREDIQLAADIRTGVIITLVASFLMVAASVGVNQAAEILDRQELHRSLHRLGMPVETVEHARRGAIMSPLLITAIGSAVCAGVLIFPLLGIALITAPASLITIATVITAGIVVVWLSTRATAPVLRRAFAAG
ncbi:FtsX-like permease family protein [Microbacterium sp. dk485]|uniref:FtsX-like permease family protein n=1 Tax=Microbacterium TaxID=33882 RepID=UPI0010744B93|nr:MULTISPECIES: FtsX-like permease family protein [Microbacterium]TFV85163.1 FtsX-like permease family protein [Microbacterium sp. dk485]TXK09293.1 FtsX-like permease family protein [Microbacterium wangchenii]